MIRYKEHTDLKNKLLKDMVPICFYVSVYLMDAENQMMEKSNNSNYSSTTDECHRQDDAARLIDTILLEDVVMVNPTSSTITHAEIEDTKDTESTVADQTFAKNDTDGNFPSTTVFPRVYRLTVSRARKTIQKFLLLKHIKKLMWIFQVLGCFPVYRLTVSQAKKIQ